MVSPQGNRPKALPDPHAISSQAAEIWSAVKTVTPLYLSPLSIPLGEGTNLPPSSCHFGPWMWSEGLGRLVLKESLPPTTMTEKQNNPPREHGQPLGCFSSHLSLPPPPGL